MSDTAGLFSGTLLSVATTASLGHSQTRPLRRSWQLGRRQMAQDQKSTQDSEEASHDAGGTKVSMNRASTVLAIIGYVFICTFAWKRYKLTIGDEDSEEENASVERDAYKYIAEQISVLQPSFWIKLAGVAMAKYFFTTLAGVDWMMVEIGKQRRYEILMEISQKIKDLEASGTAVRYPQGLKTEAERKENLQAAEERLLRLDCVFYILYDEVPMHVVEEEDVHVNPQLPSVRRRTTVLAPAVSGLLADGGHETTQHVNHSFCFPTECNMKIHVGTKGNGKVKGILHTGS